MVFGHLSIGTFGKLVTLDISKNSLYKTIFSTFFVILFITTHFDAIKSLILTKMGEFLLNHHTQNIHNKLGTCIALYIF